MLHMAMERYHPLLPDEIIINILKRLPVKSLIRFQPVCKDWKNLFQSPSFIADHLHHSHHNSPLLVLNRYCDSPQSIEINFLNDEMEIRCYGSSNSLNMYSLNHEMEFFKVYQPPLINSSGAMFVGSSNGLLCVLVNGHAYGSQRALLLWNPATREVLETMKNVRGSQIFGFGFSPTLNDYKILRISFDILMHIDQVDVYSLSTWSWKKVEFVKKAEFGLLQRVRHRCRTDIVTANGSMFWLGQEDGRKVVVSFDLEKEVFRVIPMPPSTHESHHNRFTNKVTVYENKLAMFHYLVNQILDGPSSVDLWVMEEHIDMSWSWTKKYTSGAIPSIVCPICIWRNEIVGIWRNETAFDVLEKIFKGEPHVEHLCLLNLTANKLPIVYPYDACVSFNYVESLVSIAPPTSNGHGLRFLFSHCIFSLCQKLLWK